MVKAPVTMLRWGLGLMAMVLLAVALEPVFRPETRSRTGEDLPWQISKTADTIEVFGLALGQTTLDRAIDKLGQRYDLGVFQDQRGELSLEAYFRAVLLGGFSGKMVLTLELPAEALDQLLQDRMHTGRPMPSGSMRFSLSDMPPPAVISAPIVAMTYVPLIMFDQPLINRQLGPPSEQLGGADSLQHWLYPDLGLAISWENEQVIFQYVAPPGFDELHHRLVGTTEAVARSTATTEDVSDNDRG